MPILPLPEFANSAAAAIAPAPAMLLAAGLGTRMRAYRDDLPKPLVPVAGKPLIDYGFDLLRRAGISRAVVNIHHRAAQMREMLAHTPDLELLLSEETELLETGGGVMRALPWLEEPFFVLNSDVICRDHGQDSVLKRLTQHWRDETTDALLLLQPVERACGYEGTGDFSLDKEGIIRPRAPGQAAYVFTGVQLLSRRFLSDAPGGAFGLGTLYRAATAAGSPRLRGLVHQGEWYHVGDAEGVRLAEAHLGALTAT